MAIWKKTTPNIRHFSPKWKNSLASEKVENGEKPRGGKKQEHFAETERKWRICRWVKFEEDVEEGGNRWSKPHVATLSLHSLFELRSCLMNGAVILDMEATDLPNVVGKNMKWRATTD